MALQQNMNAILNQLVKKQNASLMSEQLFYLGSHALRNNRETSLQTISCASHKYMTVTGLIQHSGAGGLFTFSPPLLRSLSKLSIMVDKHMKSIKAQKLLMPSLCPLKIWKKSGRDLVLKDELMTLNDQSGAKFCLSPTFEEMVTFLVANSNVLSSQLPIALYQIGPKFRDEPRPKHGLLRCREFTMKDMYSFHGDKNNCLNFYNETRECYKSFFDAIGLKVGQAVVEVEAPSGAMGGSVSHEFHVLADIGEDTLNKCSKCDSFYHPEVHRKCPNCTSSDSTQHSAIEVGHTFILGQKYSQVFNCIVKDPKKNKNIITPEMGCYGLGLSRILAAYIEQFFDKMETRDEINFLWNKELSPYNLSLVLPKTGNKEQLKAEEMLSFLTNFGESELNELIIDDREEIFIGKKLTDAKFMGSPFIIVLGRLLSDAQPAFELINRATGTTQIIDESDFLSTLKNLI